MKKGQRRTDNKKANKQRKHPRRRVVTPKGVKNKKSETPSLFGYLGTDDFLLGSLFLTGISIIMGGPEVIGRILRGVSSKIPRGTRCVCHSKCLLSETPLAECKGQNPSGCTNCNCYGLRDKPCVCNGACTCHATGPLGGVACPLDCPNQGSRFDGCHRCDCASQTTNDQNQN